MLRFDGVRFVEWKPLGNDSLPPQPAKLLGSKDGSLWIGGKGLAELTTHREFRRYHQLDGLWVNALVEDQDGAIWVGGVAQSGSSPLCRLYGGKAECYGDTKFMGGWVAALYKDRQGRLWAGTNDGIWQIRSGRLQKVVPYSSVIRSFAEDANGVLLFADGSNMKTLTADGKIKNYPKQIDRKPIKGWAMLKDREGTLWIGTGGQGLVHVHERLTDKFNTLDGLSSDGNYAIIQDREGTVWVASGNGLDRFTKPAVPKLTRKQGLSNENVQSVLTDSDGVSWIGTVGGIDELSDGRLITSKIKLPTNNLTSLFETSRGRMLVATNTPNGMVWLDKGKATPLRAPSGENVFEIAEDHHGDLWVVNRESGLLHLRANGDLVETFTRNNLGLRAMLLAFDAKRDGLWLTDAFGQLWLFKDGKIIERYGPADGLGDGVLRDPQVDQDGGVWVGTRIGLARLMDRKIAVLGRKNGLPCDAVHWMRHDDDHNVWLYTECGLLSFSDSDLSSWISQPSHTVTITHYLDNTEGVENIAWNGFYTPQTTKTNDGRILFATTFSGLSVLNPRDLNQNTLPPPVYIEELTVDGREIRQTDEVSLPKRARTLHFMFTALSLVVPRKVRFRYKLEGYDTKWSEPVSRREVTYTNLPPGDYEFRVIACNNDGIWNETGAHFRFTIPPAFTQKTCFKAICLLGFVALVYSAYRLRVRQVTGQLRTRMYERLEERERIARDLHDTFFQGIQGLLLRFHTATSQLRKDEPARQIFEETLKQSDQVMLEGRELVLDLRETVSEPTDLPTAFANFGEEMRKGSSGEFTVVINGDIRPLHPVVFGELFKIGKEALGNAFRHSGAHSIEAELNYEPSELRVRIRDDGTGIESAILRQGHREGHFGLPGMRERAKKVGAHLDVWSRPGAGTELELRISSGIAYVSGPSDSWLCKLRRLWAATNKRMGLTREEVHPLKD